MTSPPSEEPERTAEDLQQRADRVERDIERTRGDWERKQDDPNVPGAVPGESSDEEDDGMAEEAREAVKGDGYAVGHLDGFGDGPGFRKVRRELDVAELGVNAIIIPPGYASNFHYHEEQEELYFIHRGVAEMEFGDGSKYKLGAGGFARVDAATHRIIRSVGEEDLIYVAVGAKGGYVGRDGHAVDEESG